MSPVSATTLPAVPSARTVSASAVNSSEAQALARHVKPEVAAFMRQVFSLHEHRELHDLAEGAGLRSVSVQSKPLRVMLPPPSEFLWQYVHSTPLAGPVGEIADDERAALERDVTMTSANTGAFATSVSLIP
jgi:hypothetical protein